jgi:hypothetical protein
MRQGHTVLFATGDGPATAALAGWCRLFGERSTEEILTEIQRVTEGNPNLGAFTLLILDDDGIDIATNGELPVAVHSSSGVNVLPSTSGLTHQRLTDVSIVALTVPGAVVDGLLELERGTIAADGFEVRVTKPSAGSPWAPPETSSAPAAPQGTTDQTGTVVRPQGAGPAVYEPQPAPTPEPAPQAVPYVEPAPAAYEPAPQPAPNIVSLRDEDPDLPAAQPLPVAGAAAPAEHAHDHAPAQEAAPGRVMVRGLQCARGHFNDPRARFCGVCGIAMHQASFILVEDVRPPLGVLVFGDGSYQTLTQTAVVGRDPADDPAVRSGEAVALPLADSTNTLSRVHAELRLVDWDVQVVDRSSTNGTFVWAPGQTAWERLAPDSPRALQPGTHVSFGRLTATFESQLRQR